MRALLATLIALAFPAAAAAAVPPATLTKVDVPGTTAFAATPDDLSAYGYVEEEYYVTGTANRYRIVDPLRDAQLVDGGHLYKTRIIVRRPPIRRSSTGRWRRVVQRHARPGHRLQLGDLARIPDAQWLRLRQRVRPARRRRPPQGLEPRSIRRPRGHGANTNRRTRSTRRRRPVVGHLLQAVQALRAVTPWPGWRSSMSSPRASPRAAGRLTQYYNSIDPLHRVVDGMVFYDPATTRGAPTADDQAIPSGPSPAARPRAVPDSANRRPLGGRGDVASEPGHAVRRRDDVP